MICNLILQPEVVCVVKVSIIGLPTLGQANKMKSMVTQTLTLHKLDILEDNDEDLLVRFGHMTAGGYASSFYLRCSLPLAL